MIFIICTLHRLRPDYHLVSYPHLLPGEVSTRPQVPPSRLPSMVVAPSPMLLQLSLLGLGRLWPLEVGCLFLVGVASIWLVVGVTAVFIPSSSSVVMSVVIGPLRPVLPFVIISVSGLWGRLMGKNTNEDQDITFKKKVIFIDMTVTPTNMRLCRNSL